MRSHLSRSTWTSPLLLSLATAATLALPAEAAVDYQFSALWRADAPATTLVMAEDYDDFEDQIAYQLGQGRKLSAFESWDEGGDRRYAGLFRSGGMNRYLFVDYSEEDFEDLRLQQNTYTRYLIDVEVRLVGGEKRYSGLFMPAMFPQTEVVLDGLDATDFADWWTFLKSSYHLAVFDTWVESGAPRFYAVYHSGAEAAGTELTVASSIATFATNYVMKAALDKRVADFEVTPMSLATKISAKWEPATVRGWIGISFTEEWLTEASNNFVQGQDSSVYDIDPEDELPAPTEDPMYIHDLEITEMIYLLAIGNNPNLTKPLVDSGTPGPPKP